MAPGSSRLFVNHGGEAGGVPASSSTSGSGGMSRTAVRDFHRRLPGYEPSALVDLPALAGSWGVGQVLVKAEVERMGLPSFKILGASWATYRTLCETYGEPEWLTVDDLTAALHQAMPDGLVRLATATDGNHGRAVAHMARLLGLPSTILVPEGTARARIDGIASEGADVVAVDGTYDDAVTQAAAMEGYGEASEPVLVISDTSWPGYEDPPRWVIDGYSTIFLELEEQLQDLGAKPPDVVMVPIGVGALAAAAASCLRGRASSATPVAGDGPLLVGVEPVDAACVAAAVAAGEVVDVPGPHRSIMAGLNCGRASMLALPAVAAGFGAFVTVDDELASSALRRLAEEGLDVGETGASALAGLAALVENHAAELPLAPDATVLLLVTEGVTDPQGFESIVGRPPRP